MKHISIIVPQGPCILSSVVGPFKVFNQVNSYMHKIGKKPVFKVNLVGIGAETSLYDGLFAIRPNLLITDVAKTDLIIIPSLQGDIKMSLKINEPFIEWINHQYKQGAEIASLCTGAFLLACTGLINGKTCTTHWVAADVFKQMFPDIRLLPEKIVIDEMGIYSSGGAYSFLNLMMYLVEKYCGRDIAIYCAKVLEIDLERNSQSPFIIFMGQKEHEDEPIKKAQLYIENNVGNKISVEELAGMFAISRRNFERRFKKATANTPAEYFQRVKIEAAKKSLESGRDNINEIMYNVGYSDGKAFRNIFKKFTGLSPAEYRNKYRRDLDTPVNTLIKRPAIG